jgi:hypothetical protein
MMYGELQLAGAHAHVQGAGGGLSVPNDLCNLYARTMFSQ